MPEANVVEWIRRKFVDLASELDERGRRRWAATEARSLGRGGIAAGSTSQKASRERPTPTIFRTRKKGRSCRRLLITADSGGSNASRNRLWKLELQRFSDETGMIIEVCHYPPNTSKWNKIEHRLFCHITRNWRGVPLETREIVVESSGHTRTESGREVHAWLDDNTDTKGIKVSDHELADCLIKRNTFHGDWNYEIHPRK